MNQPDLVLFVGEALVGNEAVDQLTKFNQSLADHSNVDNPRLIDGIILTKFDAIDDKVSCRYAVLTLYHTILTFNDLSKKPFENIVGKGENDVNQHFLLFPHVYNPI